MTAIDLLVSSLIWAAILVGGFLLFGGLFVGGGWNSSVIGGLLLWFGAATVTIVKVLIRSRAKESGQ